MTFRKKKGLGAVKAKRGTFILIAYISSTVQWKCFTNYKNTVTKHKQEHIDKNNNKTILRQLVTPGSLMEDDNSDIVLRSQNVDIEPLSKIVD